MQMVQAESIGWNLLAPGLFALFFLFLGAVAASLRRGFAIKKLICDAVLWGNFIIVFVVVCIPIVMISALAYGESGDISVLFISIVPIFSAGLALEEHAERIVKGAKREAENEADPPEPT